MFPAVCESVLSHNHSSCHAGQMWEAISGMPVASSPKDHSTPIGVSLSVQPSVRRQFSCLPGVLKRKCSGEGDLWQFLLLHSETIPLHLHSSVNFSVGTCDLAPFGSGLYAARTFLHSLSKCDVFRLVPVVRAEFCSWYPVKCPGKNLRKHSWECRCP